MIRNTGELVKQARAEGRAEANAEIRRLRAEVRRLRGWLRQIVANSDRDVAVMLGSMAVGRLHRHAEAALHGDPAPKARKP